MQKSLDRKLAAIHADPSGCREFIIADAGHVVQYASEGFSVFTRKPVEEMIGKTVKQVLGIKAA